MLRVAAQCPGVPGLLQACGGSEQLEEAAQALGIGADVAAAHA